MSPFRWVERNARFWRPASGHDTESRGSSPTVTSERGLAESGGTPACGGFSLRPNGARRGGSQYGPPRCISAQPILQTSRPVGFRRAAAENCRTAIFEARATLREQSGSTLGRRERRPGLSPFARNRGMSPLHRVPWIDARHLPNLLRLLQLAQRLIEPGF